MSDILDSSQADEKWRVDGNGVLEIDEIDGAADEGGVGGSTLCVGGAG